MKKSLLIAALTLAAGPIVHPPVSHAAGETVCASTNVADAGYTIVIAPNLRAAVLSEETIAGPRKVADMDCHLLPVKRFPDSLNNYLVCRDARAPRTGLVARLFSGGFAGVHYAVVSDAQGHELELGRLNCRR
jgi:hypothetical protein